MTKGVENFEVAVHYRGSIRIVHCSRYWFHESVLIHCYVHTGGKWEKTFNFQDISGIPLVDLIVLQSGEELNILIKKELEKIRHTFMIYSEPGKRMFPDWSKGEKWSFS